MSLNPNEDQNELTTVPNNSQNSSYSSFQSQQSFVSANSIYSSQNFLNADQSTQSDYQIILVIPERKSFIPRKRLNYIVGIVAVILIALQFVFSINSQSSLISRGNTFIQQGDYSKAVDLYTQAIQDNRNSKNTGRAYTNRCEAYNFLSQYQQALQDCNKAFQINPNDYFVFRNRCVVYYNLKDYQAALADCNKGISLNSQDFFLYSERALIYWKQQNFQAALLDFDKAVQLNGNEGTLYYDRGLAYVKVGNITQARNDFQQAINLGDSDAQQALNKLPNQ